tara:strand:+ start:361 stop:939 length:579 start_codon:yes stop_codon:yes gene_type:complete
MASTLKVNTIQHTGGTTGITLNSNGIIYPKVPCFRADKSIGLGWTTGGGDGQLVTFNHIDGSGGSGDHSFNIGFDLSTIGTTGKVSPPVNGIYSIKAAFLINNNNASTSTAYVSIQKNAINSSDGATFLINHYEQFPANYYYMVEVQATAKLTTSDYFGIGKHDGLKYWGAGVNNNADYGYNFVECRLISTS